MRLLGIDYGQKRIGLALGEVMVARPYLVLENNKRVIEKITQICQQEAIEKIILGLSSDLVIPIKRFARSLEKMAKLPLIFVDETLTTKKGTDKMIISQTSKKSRREKIDAVAAAEILEEFFQGGENV